MVVWTCGAEDLGGIAGFQCDIANDDRCDNFSSRNKRQRERTLAQVYPETAVAPNVAVVTTDARHYSILSKDVYRFLPVEMNAEDLKRAHGANERIGIENFAKAIEFYCQLIRNAAG